MRFDCRTVLCVGCPLRNFLITPPLHTAWGGGLAAPLGRNVADDDHCCRGDGDGDEVGDGDHGDV